MLKRIAHGSLTLALAFLLGACVANDMGMEWEEIPEADSDLVFYGPGLGGGYRKFLFGQGPQFDTVTVAVYGPGSGGFPRALIQLFEAAPQRHFLTAMKLSRYVAETEFFKGRTITPGINGDSRNPAGDIKYFTFMADTMPCVAFMQFMGSRDEGGLGDKRLSGYYCKGESKPAISAGDAVEIVGAIGHREHGVPKPPKGWGA